MGGAGGHHCPPRPSWPVSEEPYAGHVRHFCLPVFCFVPEAFKPVFRKRLHVACPLGPHRCVGVSLGPPGKPSATSGRSVLLPQRAGPQGCGPFKPRRFPERKACFSWLLAGASLLAPPGSTRCTSACLGPRATCPPGPPPEWERAPGKGEAHPKQQQSLNILCFQRAQASCVSL